MYGNNFGPQAPNRQEAGASWKDSGVSRRGARRASMRGMTEEHAWRSARVAREYEHRRFRTPLQRWKHRRDERLVLGLLGTGRAGGRVLDLPCGTGRLVPALSGAGFHVVGGLVLLL